VKPEWQRQLEEMAGTAKLSLMIILAMQLARMVAISLVEEILAERGQAKTEWGKCEKCGKRLESKGFAKRQIASTLGTIEWKRRLGRCPNQCKIGQVAPLDEELGISAHQKSDRGLQKMACLVAIFVPFALAGKLISQLSGVAMSGQTIWAWVQASGKPMRESVEGELKALAAGVEPEVEAISRQAAADTLLIGSDGVMVAFRPQSKTACGSTQWREVKVAIFARVSKSCTRAGKAVTRLYRHRVAAVLGNIDSLSERMWLEALKQGVKQTAQVVWLSDGGRGFWRIYDERFRPYAIGVLDFYHAAQNLWAALKVWFDERTTHAKTAFADTRHRLRQGQADSVLADIAAALLLPGLPDTTHQALTKLYLYLDKHRDHIQYAKLKELGLPIGSGFVESTCKWLIQQRFKGVGMRWSEDGFNHLLHLRLAWVNGRFDAFFDDSSPSPKS
jgi:hypothetical protein